MRPRLATLLARSHRERLAFWIGLDAAYATIVLLAASDGIGYTLRLEAIGPREFLAVPEYNPVLWLPAVLGAGAWGPAAWVNTIYWLSAATLAGLGLARLVRRAPGGPRLDREEAPDPGPVPPARDPPAPAADPPAPARTRLGE